MHPYKMIRLTECPDVADIQKEGRRSAIGKLKEDKHGYFRKPIKKKIARRRLKRRNRMLEIELEKLDERE